MKNTICFSCKAPVPDIEGPTHSYILSSPGCWKLYGEVLAKDYSPEYFDEQTHRIVVDTYAASHPGNEVNRKAVRSVNIHLLGLYCVFEKKMKGNVVLEIIKQAAEDKSIGKYNKWLNPPGFSETLNVTDVLKANNPSEHRELVQDWGFTVWNEWKSQSVTYVENLFNKVFNQRY